MNDFSRRRFLRTASLMGLAAFSAPLAATPAWITGKARFISYPFTLGVASGDPLATGFVLWTRLAPDPLDSTAAGAEPIPVSYQVAEDEGFKRVVQKGAVVAHAENAHAVHVDVTGLQPGREYFYRFRAGDEVSPTGRALTLPTATTALERFKLAICSCQNYEQGYFKAYRDMIAQDVDLIVHLGDYIYEYGVGGPLRRSPVTEAKTLADYRLLHSVYKLDPDLQAAHAHTSWLTTWDDHEVANDYAADQGQFFEDTKEFLLRRAAAYKAYYEHLPLRRAAAPIGPNATIFQRVNVGNLIEINMLDTRQYRTDQPCQTPDEGGWQLIDGKCEDRFDPARTILGEQQEKWLLWGMGRADAKWNVMAQGMLFSKHDYKPGEGELIGSEYWDGYVTSRDRVLDMFEKRKIANPIIVGGDVHANYVCDVKRDFEDPSSKTVASEFVATSITSGNWYWQRNMPSIPENPHIKLYEGQYRGYTLVEADQKTWTTDLRIVNDVTKPELEASTLKRFVVEDGVPGPKEA
jgi:alkaline phosphatase D